MHALKEHRSAYEPAWTPPSELNAYNLDDCAGIEFRDAAEVVRVTRSVRNSDARRRRRLMREEFGVGV